MKTGAELILKSPFKLTLLFLFFAISTATSYAQETEGEDTEEQQVDSVKTGFSLGKLRMDNPESIVSKYVYNPKLKMYIYSEKVGNFDIGYPIILTPDQYYELVRQEGIKNYFKEKSDAYSGKKEGSEEARRNLLPNFYTNKQWFQSIFGGNTIEVIPQGSVAMDLGVIWQKNDNPSLSPRNRTNTSFDFDQRISLSMLGKIGERLQVTANYDTEATFDFQNIVKLDYTPTEDDILRSIEVGNISMPLNSSLIQGSQSLFGVKSQLQFGKTSVTAVFSQQQSQNNTVVAQGGGTLSEFEVTALDYDEDRHFFLAQYFRDNYDAALENYPYIRSQVQITRLEVWVTNRSQQTQNVRNVVGIQDLGEYDPLEGVVNAKTRIYREIAGNAPPPNFFNLNNGGQPNGLPRNNANDYDPAMIGSGGVLTESIRDVATVEQGFNVPGYQPNQGFDYAYLENARKLELVRDYNFNSQLGYIQLNQRLSNDEILAVAYQYTYNGNVYQVGEFANGGIDATTASGPVENPVIDNNTLILKLLKSNITNVSDPIWDLMMKNIYATGAFRLSLEDFKMNILYSNPTPRNYITPIDDATWPDGLQDRILLNVFNFDRLNAYNDLQPGGDGFFDFVPGITVDTQNGQIIFTKVEPFGKYLFEELGSGNYEQENTYNPNQERYVFKDMYDLTKAAALQDPEKNRFLLKGRYKSEGSNGIPIGAFNVPRGSVRVTAGGRQLQEGIDYTVNYQAGTVQILDPSLEASNTPINISVENNAVFGQQTRRFTGVNVEHQFNENFVLGATLLNLNERPLTQKSNFGVEPVNNTIFGINGNFSTEVPFLTRLVNKLPNIDTDVPSNLSVRGEMAWLRPNSPKNADFQGETTTYLDDFEGAQSLIDVRSSLGWALASTPVEFLDTPTQKGLETGFNRAKMAWYTIDPVFYTNQRPSEISDSDISTNATRRIFVDEVFPKVEIAQGQTRQQTTLDLAFYPNQKGPYNANDNFENVAADQKWGGIMRSLSSTNFEQANVEFVQFWVMDPYVDGIATGTGELVLNLGNITEDILADGLKQYENGLPINGEGSIKPENPIWGPVPATQALVYAFDVNEDSRVQQDVGFDGLDDEAETAIYGTENGPDPALDNYEYFLQRDGGILDRYLNFNNPQGNSPVQVTNDNRGSTTLPDVEDIDRDLTMNTVNSYYEYRVPIKPNTNINDLYVTDIRDSLVFSGDNRIPDGSTVRTRWIQYKIPLNDFTDAVGGITDFRSISSMRLYMTGFTSDVILRFATLDLVRGDWRTYLKPLDNNDPNPDDDNTTLEVNAVNIQENENRTPIPYVLPPGVFREQLNNNNTIIQQNEQSLSLIVENLEPEDARGVFKNINIDVRQYKKLKMFMHAEKILETDIYDIEQPLVGFLRIGTDFSENFYQLEVPLEFTPFSARSAEAIWPKNNEMEVVLADLNKVKSVWIDGGNLNEIRYFEVVDGEVIPVDEFADRTLGRLRIGIRGNPSLGSIRSAMVGVKNASRLPVRGEVWFNELRLAGLDNEGGWAAIAAIDGNIADFANITATGSTSTSGFGSIDQMPNERAREDAISYDLVTNVNIGQLLPPKWGIQIPFNYGISEAFIIPEFDPVYDDLKLDDRIAAAEDPASTLNPEDIKEQAEDYTKRTSLNLIGVRKERGEEADENFYDIENFTFNYSYNETNHRDFEIASLEDQSVVTGFVYNHNFKPVEVTPFAKNDSLFMGKYWQWLKELNLSLLPTSVSVNSNFNRQFNQQRFRDVVEKDVEKLDLPTLRQRNYLFNWQYAVNYSLTKSLRMNLTASNNHIVRNYLEDPSNPNSEIDQTLGLWDGFWDLGEPNRHAQTLELNYELPFSKIPILDFINAQYSYMSNFDWQRGGDALNLAIAEQQNPNPSETNPLQVVSINTVQNASTHNLTANLTMQKFYDMIGLKKRDGKSSANTAPVRKDKAGNPVSGGEKQKKKTNGFYNTSVDILTMVKRLNVNYNQTSGKVLPGYTQSVGFVGSLRPSVGFVFGSQADVRFNAARKGWLVNFNEFNEQYIESVNKQLNITATAIPTRDLTIDLSSERQFIRSYQENYDIDLWARNENPLGNEYGNFSISTLLIGTVFGKSDEFDSATFEKFKENRITVANRLEAERGNQSSGVDEEGYPDLYGKTQQDVLLPAFFAAYTGQNANRVNLDVFRQIPIPNWNLKYTGLMRNKWFKKKFQRFSLSHGYRAAYSINSFQTNLEKVQLRNDGLPQTDPETGNLLPDLILNNVVLNDEFNPLMRVDFEMKNSVSMLAEMRTSRILALSFDNNLMTETNGKEYTVGLGYRFKDVKFVTNIGGNKTRLKGDLNLKGDITLRDNITIIRNLDIDNNQITSGQNLLSIKFTADYALSKNLNALFFYDHSFSQFAVSTAFPQTTINTGFTLRYNFGN